MDIFQMREDEIQVAFDLAHLEGWATGKHDHKAISDEFESKVFGLKVGGEIVSVIAVIKYGSSYSYIGLYICKNTHRGKGYAYELWKYVMKTIEGRNVSLDAAMNKIQM